MKSPRDVMTRLELAAREIRQYLRRNLKTGAPLLPWSKIDKNERRIWCEAVNAGLFDLCPEPDERDKIREEYFGS